MPPPRRPIQPRPCTPAWICRRRPAPLSSTRPPPSTPISIISPPQIEQQIVKIEQQQIEGFGTSDAKRDAAAPTLRRAHRESTARLNTPLDASRYHDLPPLEPARPPQPPRAAVPRRHEQRWRAARALDPELRGLYVPERDPEQLDTASDFDAVALLGGAEPWAVGGSGLGLGGGLGGGLAAVGAGVDARRGAAVALGEQLPLGR